MQDLNFQFFFSSSLFHKIQKLSWPAASLHFHLELQQQNTQINFSLNLFY